MPRKQNVRHQHRGFTLIELLITITVLGLVLSSIFSVLTALQRIARDNLGRSSALNIAQEYLETARNLPYTKIGTSETYPTGPLPATFTVTRNAITFYGQMAIKDVDDPADSTACVGTPPPVPCDTAPADYKQVEVRICIDAAGCTNPVRLTTNIVAKGVETAPNTGALFITVIDANGQPVPLVNVTVTNSTVSPAVNITNRTDINGKLQLLSLPPSQKQYQINLTKAGYTTAGTIVADGSNSNPLQQPASVVIGSVTTTTFLMDHVNTLNIAAKQADDCSANTAVTLHLRGQRLIGSAPNVYLVDRDITLDASGNISIGNLPWDDYQLTIVSAGYDLAGMSPPDAIRVEPGSVVSASIVTAAHHEHTLRVIVKISGSNAPLANATVHVTGPSFDQTIVTDQGTIRQTDWSGGAGQSTFIDPSKYATPSGAPDISQAGQVTIASTDTNHSFAENFSDTNHRDGGSTDANWSTADHQLILPVDSMDPTQFVGSAQAQSDTLNNPTGLITKATLTTTADDHGQSISYWLSVDGINYEAVTAGVEHVFSGSGMDLRWRATLNSSDPHVTPVITGINIQYQQAERSTLNAGITSSTFDNGAGTNYLTINWAPTSQPPSAGNDSLKFQVATNDDATSWNYLGPDGTDGSYFTTSSTSLPAALSNKRYLRYRAFLRTTSPASTPTLSDIAIIKNNSCTPPGQAFFSPLTNGDYHIDANATGYQATATDVAVSGQTVVVITLTPNP